MLTGLNIVVAGGTQAGTTTMLHCRRHHCHSACDGVVSAADAMWPWPRAFVEVGLERLVSIGAMSRDEAAATWTDFLVREASPGTRMVNPIVLEVVATRPY